MQRRKFLKATGSALLYLNSSPVFSEDLSISDEYIKDSIATEAGIEKDFVLDDDGYKNLKNINKKLKNLRSIVGYGNFNLLGIDEAIYFAKRYSKIGKFSKQELNFLEELFYHSASSYGFYGEKVLTNISDKIAKKETIKIPKTGHYLFKGKPVEVYEKIKKEIGENKIILTSGVRGIIKQTQLFTAKAVQKKGNFSQASRSLAPPGYSYHGIGDFDIGKVGYGYRNFTADFAKTDEYKRLMDLGYITIRYPLKNPYGVRFEPWHIKVYS